jgi:hypothetical protein
MSVLAIQFTFKDSTVCKYDRTYTCILIESDWYLLYRVTLLRIFVSEGLSYKVHVAANSFRYRLYVWIHAGACVSEFRKNYTETGSRFKSVSIVSGLHAWRLRNQCLILGRGRDSFCYPQHPDHHWGPPSSYTLGTGSSLPGGKAAGA